MFRLVYQIGIQLLIIYFKIADLIGNSKAKAYNSGRKQWKETLSGLHKDKSTYWIHAASHGEGLMAIPLIEKLLEKKPSLKHKKERVFKNSYVVQHWDKPARTIISHLYKDGNQFIHPDYKQERTLTCLLYTSPSPRD